MCDTTGATSLSLRNPRPDLPKPDSLTQHPHPSTNNNNINNHNHTNSHKPAKHSHNSSAAANDPVLSVKQNQVGTVLLFGVPIVSLVMDGKERLCLAQISSTLLKEFSYNEIHNRRVALGITCVQCTPVQLEILRRAGAMPVTSRRCGMITRREAERLCQSFLGDHAPPQLPENFAFEVYHECGWGCRGSFVPSRYNSSRAKCIRCTYCQLFFSPNKFIFHSHRLPDSRYVQPDAANFNSWRRHLKLCGDPPDDDASSNTLSMDTAQIVHAWEDVRAMFNGGTRKRMLAAHHHHHTHSGGSEGHHHMRRSLKSANNNNTRSNTPHPLQSQQHANQSAQQPHQRAGNGNDHFQQSSPQINHNQSTQSSQQGQGTRVESPSIVTTPNSFLTVPSPLLSPSGRLETIWNPVIGSHPSGHKGLNLPSTVPHLPFHPLALPWLRRPLFPFPHPFAPCHLLTSDPNSATISTPISEKLHSGVAERILNHSAFKPVSRANAEQLFTWLNNNNTLLGPNNATGILNSFNPSQTSLPEDLSLHPGVGVLAAHPSQGCSLKGPLISSERLAGDRKELPPGTIIGALDLPSVSIPSVSSTIEETSPTSLDQSPPSRGRGNNVTSSSGSCGRHHQIHILSNTAGEEDSDDEENVDIESTEVDECCSSTSSINWVGNSRGVPVDQKVCDFTRKRKRSCDTFSDDNQDDYEDAKDSDLDDDNFKRVSKLIGKSNSSKQKKKRIWDLGNGTGNPRQIMSCSPTPNSK